MLSKETLDNVLHTNFIPYVMDKCSRFTDNKCELGFCIHRGMCAIEAARSNNLGFVCKNVYCVNNVACKELQLCVSTFVHNNVKAARRKPIISQIESLISKGDLDGVRTLLNIKQAEKDVRREVQVQEENKKRKRKRKSRVGNWCMHSDMACDQHCRIECVNSSGTGKETAQFKKHLDNRAKEIAKYLQDPDFTKYISLARLMINHEHIAFNKGVYAKRNVVYYKYRRYKFPTAKSIAQAAMNAGYICPNNGYDDQTNNFHEK